VSPEQHAVSGGGGGRAVLVGVLGAEDPADDLGFAQALTHPGVAAVPVDDPGQRPPGDGLRVVLGVDGAGDEVEPDLLHCKAFSAFVNLSCPVE